MNKNYKVGELIYDAHIYDGMNAKTDDLLFYKRWLPKKSSASILELCCGTGRLTIPIAKQGYDIYGVDNSASMLELARAKANNEATHITFIEADIRDFDIAKRFDLIFIPFNSIHHLYENDDLFKTLKVVKNHLKEEGVFILDCFNPNIKFIVNGEQKEKEIAKYSTSDGRDILIKETMTYENKSQVNRIKWHYYIDGRFDSVQNLDMRLFFPQELDYYLQENGFRIINKFGDFDEKEFQDESEKQIFICKLE